MPSKWSATAVSKREKKLIERDLELKHHIPYSLVELLPCLGNVQLRDKLGSFASSYINEEFDEEPEEYKRISEVVSEMMKELGYTPAIVSKVESIMIADLAYSEADSQYREHFIHPFQTFLLGTIVIDKYYSQFQGWWTRISPTEPTSFEKAWLLASLFHDHVKPVSALRQLTRDIMRTRGEEISGMDEIPNADELIGLIDNAYRSACASTSSQLGPILDTYHKKGNHGVVGALNVLNWIRSSGSIATLDAVAALAIALHDGDYTNNNAFRNALKSAGIFPAHYENQPLTCLLLWCDTNQEWGGRKRRIEIDTRLVAVSFEDEVVNVRLSFEDRKAIKDKLEELSNVGECYQESGLSFTTDFRIHPAGLGLRRSCGTSAS